MSFRELIGDMFNEPRVGWYNQDKNILAQKLGRMDGGTFYPHLVNRYDPKKVRFIDEPVDMGTYQKVRIPRNSEVTESGRYYRVSPKDIIPYDEYNKNKINRILDNAKWLGYIGEGTSILAPGLIFGLATKPLPAGEDPDWIPPVYPVNGTVNGYINYFDK